MLDCYPQPFTITKDIEIERGNKERGYMINKIGIKNKKKAKTCAPNGGLEPTTLRLKV